MRTLRNFLMFAILFTLVIGSGCSSKQSQQYETKVHRVQYTYSDCGDLKLKNIGIRLEDPNDAHSIKNQKILTNNLIILDYKIKEAETIIQCYKKQQGN